MNYDPCRQQGVSVYRDRERAFSVGDRVQFTAPANDLKVANRELGTITDIDEDGRTASERMAAGASASTRKCIRTWIMGMPSRVIRAKARS